MLGVAKDWRNEWYEKRIASAPSLKGKVLILQGKLLADAERLPERWRDEALVLIATMTETIADEIQQMCAVERWTA